MIRHIVWWTLKPEAEGRSAAENAELMKKAARGLIGKIPGLLSLDISGTVLGTSTMPAELVLHSTHCLLYTSCARAVHGRDGPA